MQGFTSREWMQDRSRDVFGEDKSIGVLAVVLILAVMSLLVTVVIGNLIGLHVWLRKVKNMTTYEYILYLRNLRKYASAVRVIQPTHRGDSFNGEAENASGAQLLPPDDSHLHKASQVVPDLEISLNKRKESLQGLHDLTKSNSKAEFSGDAAAGSVCRSAHSSGSVSQH